MTTGGFFTSFAPVEMTIGDFFSSFAQGDEPVLGNNSPDILVDLEISVDRLGEYCKNSFCCFGVRRYLSWIEGLTTNQYVGGSNPSRRTTYSIKNPQRLAAARAVFLLAKERNVLEGSKIETSQ